MSVEQATAQKSAPEPLTTEQITKETAKKYGTCTVIAAWLAVFCLFGYRSSFSIMQSSLMEGMSWTSTQASLGYCFMMTFNPAAFSSREVNSVISPSPITHW